MPHLLMVEQSDDLIRKEIQGLEQHEAEAFLRADVAALEAFWADDLLVSSTANLTAGKKGLLDLIRDGRLRVKTYKRITNKIALRDDIAVVVGNENSELDGIGSGALLLCSYINVWIRRNERWQLFGRHVGLIARVRPDLQST
ncbi:MAG: nuclear transport factor 2 family protein [Candidatus Binataceae bacterium]